MALSSVARDDGRRQRRGPADFACTAPTDNDEANAPIVVALQRLALTRPLLCPPLLLEGVDEEANALTVVALQRLALTKPLLLMLLPSLAMHVGRSLRCCCVGRC